MKTLRRFPDSRGTCKGVISWQKEKEKRRDLNPRFVYFITARCAKPIARSWVDRAVPVSLGFVPRKSERNGQGHLKTEWGPDSTCFRIAWAASLNAVSRFLSQTCRIRTYGSGAQDCIFNKCFGWCWCLSQIKKTHCFDVRGVWINKQVSPPQ